MKNLVDYLSELNAVDNTWGLWVDPNDINNYRIGRFCFENGGLLDNFICIGDLSDLSFGFQSHKEVLETILDSNTYSKDSTKAELFYNEKKVLVKKESILELFFENSRLLNTDFYTFLEDSICELANIWSTGEAELFVEEQLPQLLAKDYENETLFSHLD